MIYNKRTYQVGTTSSSPWNGFQFEAYDKQDAEEVFITQHFGLQQWESCEQAYERFLQDFDVLTFSCVRGDDFYLEALNGDSGWEEVVAYQAHFDEEDPIAWLLQQICMSSIEKYRIRQEHMNGDVEYHQL